jgi:predicted nucleic acid-binding protein
MSAAADSTPIFDILRPGSPHQKHSLAALERARKEGTIAICEPVYGEVASILTSKADLDAFLRDLGIRLVPSSASVLHQAGLAWRRYTQRRPDGLRCAACGTVGEPVCEKCGERLRARQHIMADFIVGAHASANGGALITRDRRYYRTYFPDLNLL